MIVRNASIDTRNTAAAAVATGLEAKMQLSTVKLHHQNFSGSGVIFATGMDRTFVLTAKHNLTVWARGEGRDEEALRTGAWGSSRGDLRNLHRDFKTNITLTYGNGREASISEIVYFGADWSYDVCCLVVRDGGLRSFANDRAWIFEPFATQGDNFVYDYSYKNALQGIFNNLRDRNTSGDIQPSRKTSLNNNYYFFQAGYGKTAYNGNSTNIANINQDSGGNFGFRVAEIDNSWAAAVDNDTTEGTVDTYTDAIALTAAHDNSSAPGDSGGPIFAMPKNQTRSLHQISVYLVAVTTGYNYHRNQNDAIQSDARFRNNIVTDIRAAYNATTPVVWGTTGAPQDYTELWESFNL